MPAPKVLPLSWMAWEVLAGPEKRGALLLLQVMTPRPPSTLVTDLN
ncbi:hypothetical protein P7D22_05995 [Lichenihabitans sp. Uapishka_5]|nr:hypothetical protein [Lichenihabitans sp. Uapishka_5]MDX7950730.1 hypothetical protein [Lichenihabitans sp. Uapishka_5]